MFKMRRLATAAAVIATGVVMVGLPSTVPAQASSEATAVPSKTYTLKYIAVDAPGSTSPLTTNAAAASCTALVNEFYQRINGSAATFIHGGFTSTSRATVPDCSQAVSVGMPSFTDDPATDKTIAVYATGPSLNCSVTAGKASVGGAALAVYNGLTNVVGDPRTLIHEIGHTLGLDHSNGLACTAGGSTTTGAFDLRGANCTELPYNSPHSTMGGVGADNVTPHNLASNQMLYLGGLRFSDVYTAASTGTYTINSLLSGSGKRAVLIPASPNPWTVEYRPATGTEATNTSVTHPTYGIYPGAGAVVRRIGSPNASTAPNNRESLVADFQLYPTNSPANLAQKPAVFHPGATITLPDGSTLTFGSQTGTTATITITRPADTTGPQGAVSALPSGYSLGDMSTMDVAVEGVGDNRSDVTVVCKNNGATVTVAKQVLFAYNEPTITCAVPVQPGTNRVTLVGTDEDGNSTVFMDRTYTTTSLPGAPPPLNPDTPPTTTTATLTTRLSKNTRKKITITVSGKNITRATVCHVRTRTTATSRWKKRAVWQWTGTKKATLSIKKGYVQARCGTTASPTKRFT